MGMSTLALDVTNSESIASAKTEVEELTGGKLYILVNNAYVSPLPLPFFPNSLSNKPPNSGRNLTLPALDVPLSEARLTFETNFFSILALTQTFTPLLIAASPSLILNIGSVAAIVPYAFGSVYGASKAALHSWSNTLRLELEPFGVRVQVVVTGGVKSRIARTERGLPEGSLYLEVQEEFGRRVRHSQEGAMETGVYAREVVREALREVPRKWVWWGNRAGLVRFVEGWIGGWVWDLVMPRMFGLVRLR
jgi:1-acylglycerone phosphate reductase